MSVLERPEKILVLCCGSRGDVQPYIALVKALEAAAFKVLLGSNVNHESIVQECGVNFFGIFGDAEKVCRENETIRSAMANGSTIKFMQGLAEYMEDFAVFQATSYKQAMEDFKPDLVITSQLLENFAIASMFWYNVPCFYLMQTYVPMTPKRMIFGLPNLPFGLNSWFVKNILTTGAWQGMVKADEKAHVVQGYKVTEFVTKQWMIDEAADPDVIPRLIVLNSQWFDMMFPGTNPSVVPVGNVALSSEFEQEVASTASRTNFGNAAELERIKAFLAAGSTPIYMGWGSMTCKSTEYMVQLVTSAVKLAGYRAIIQAGWAGLSLEVLKSSCKDKGLIEYAEHNILFIDSAPHEWLFPQCLCTVQHGGAGTCSTSLRSGTPCVITPIFLDQFDNAYGVNQLGVGVGFEKLQFQRISAKELAKAISKCVTSDDIRAKAQELGQSMRSTDGARRVAEYVDDFWATHVRTGRQQRMVQALLKKRQAPKERCGNCACLPRPAAARK